MTEMEFWKRLQDYLGIDNEERVHALGEIVLEALSARLTFDEAEDLKAQLPAGLKPIWERHEHEMHKWNREQFVSKIREESFLESDAETEHVIQSVFCVLQEGISAGEAEDVTAQLPGDMKPLWESAGALQPAGLRKENRRIIY